MSLRKCLILLPTTYNDGAAVPPKVVNGILKDIDQEFDGHTIAGTCNGTYRMKDGSMAEDKSLIVWVAVDPDRVDVLKKLVGKFARILKQESLYFELTNAEVEFIEPQPETGEAP